MAAVLLDRLRVVLVRTRNPLNIGASARAMSNFGFSRLRVVAPYDVAFREARSAVGALELLKSAEQFQRLADAVADCSLVVGTTAAAKRRIVHPLKRLDEGAREIRKRLAEGPVALLFGSEKRGLSTEDFTYCHWLMRIPTAEQNTSMNLGQAVAVCLYELARSGDLSPASSSPPESPHAGAAQLEHADIAQLERMTDSLFEAMLHSGYVKPGSEAASLEKARRMVWRMTLRGEDAETWIGILAKISLMLRKSQRNHEE